MFCDPDEDLIPQYFIAIEQKLMCECNSLTSALFNLVAVHYVFNIEYCRQVKDFFLFLEEMILNIDGSTKLGPAYLQISAAIGCFHQENDTEEK